MTPIKNSVRITAIIVGFIYAVTLVLSGITLDTWLKQVLGLLPTIAALAVVAFDLWIWKWTFIHKYLSRPFLTGTWKVVMTPHPDSHIPEGGNRGPIEAYLVIEQTYWTLSATLHTKESSSRSRAARFIPREAFKSQVLTYMFENTPGREHRHRSTRHIGACELSIESGRPETIVGEYFTDRFTAGSMNLKRHDRSIGHSGFDAAQKHCA